EPIQTGSSDTVRMIAMIGVIGCGGIQAFCLAGGDDLVLFAIIALLTWFFWAKQLLPIYLFFLGNLLIRLALLANNSLFVFRDFGFTDFLFHLFDSVTFVGLMACAFIYFELLPQRLPNGFKGVNLKNNDAPEHWYSFEPYGGMLVRFPVAVAIALLIYFLSQQIRSPINPLILKVQFAQGYLLFCVLFLLFLLAKTCLDVWACRKATPEEAQFYLQGQIGLELGEELDAIQKPAWSRLDHPSALGGMFCIQMIFSGVVAAIMMSNTRASELDFMGGVAALFVFLTAMYNSYRTARNDVSSENHVIALVGFIVVLFVGIQGNGFSDWRWELLYFGWWGVNALVVIRMSYLWLVDEHFARKYNWETAKPFSRVRFLVFLTEGILGLVTLYFVVNKLITTLSS
ncbi:MAG: hypothetical protein VX438_05860, partial [Planctomycetota bacterium]|nr:hypothetical protein [Planctomycetota bacterium]